MKCKYKSILLIGMPFSCLVLTLSIFFTTSQSAAGQVKKEWVARYNGPDNSFDQANAVAVDTDGNIYVTGESWSLYGNGSIRTDYVTIKYDPDGNELRVIRYDDLSTSHKNITTLFIPVIYQDTMIVDVVGNVYVIILESSSKYATIKYDPYGKEMWANRYYGPDNSSNQPNALEVDDTGNVYITGGSSEFSSYDYYTIKLVQIVSDGVIINDDSGDGGCFIAATID